MFEINFTQPEDRTNDRLFQHYSSMIAMYRDNSVFAFTWVGEDESDYIISVRDICIAFDKLKLIIKLRYQAGVFPGYHMKPSDILRFIFVLNMNIMGMYFFHGIRY